LIQIKAGLFPGVQNSHKRKHVRERAMLTTDILLLAGLVAFAGFGLVLAWGDFETLDIARKSRERALSGAAGNAGRVTHH
jgi:hypothetical protein